MPSLLGRPRGFATKSNWRNTRCNIWASAARRNTEVLRRGRIRRRGAPGCRPQLPVEPGRDWLIDGPGGLIPGFLPSCTALNRTAPSSINLGCAEAAVQSDDRSPVRIQGSGCLRCRHGGGVFHLGCNRRIEELHCGTPTIDGGAISCRRSSTAASRVAADRVTTGSSGPDPAPEYRNKRRGSKRVREERSGFRLQNFKTAA
jgi:hypothetical protein